MQDQDVQNFMADDDENYQQDLLSEPGALTSGLQAHVVLLYSIIVVRNHICWNMHSSILPHTTHESVN